jgi:hypothetical protein
MPRRLIGAALLAGVVGCQGDRQPRARTEGARLDRVRLELAASFLGGQARGLRRLLHADLIVQPPEPDSSLRAEAAADYLEGLARRTAVRRSELLPADVWKEGTFLLERGTWILESGRGYHSQYMIRWTEAPTGWKVVLWRWSRFR